MAENDAVDEVKDSTDTSEVLDGDLELKDSETDAVVGGMFLKND